jgi:hypothetical protein
VNQCLTGPGQPEYGPSSRPIGPYPTIIHTHTYIYAHVPPTPSLPLLPLASTLMHWITPLFLALGPFMVCEQRWRCGVGVSKQDEKELNPSTTLVEGPARLFSRRMVG